MKLWKVQKFFGDIVYDLRSRGLLPVLILLVVGMVAVPILISRGSSGSSVPALQPTAGAAKAAPEAESAVVSYSPGLRNYKKRLDDLSAKDPFVQPVSSAPSAAAASQLSSTVATPTTVSGGSAGTGSSSTATSPSTGTSTGTTTTHHLYLYRSVADISVGDVSQPLQRHKHINPFTSLPNQVTPVLVYLGSTLNEKRAYFTLSKTVDQLTGQGTCAPSPTDCTLLALGPGQTEDMVYSVDGKTYRVKVNKVSLVRVAVKSSP